jgi:hypothetical protein
MCCYLKVLEIRENVARRKKKEGSLVGMVHDLFFGWNQNIG